MARTKIETLDRPAEEALSASQAGGVLGAGQMSYNPYTGITTYGGFGPVLGPFTPHYFAYAIGPPVFYGVTPYRYGRYPPAAYGVGPYGGYGGAMLYPALMPPPPITYLGW